MAQGGRIVAGDGNPELTLSAATERRAMQVRDSRRTIGPVEALTVTLVTIFAGAAMPAPGPIAYVALLAIVAVAAYVWVWILKWAPGPIRYSVRTLLVAMTVTSVVLAVWVVVNRK
jgi:hypothetical protein